MKADRQRTIIAALVISLGMGLTGCGKTTNIYVVEPAPDNTVAQQPAAGSPAPEGQPAQDEIAEAAEAEAPAAAVEQPSAPVGDISGDDTFDEADVQCYIDDFIAEESTGCNHATLAETDLNCDNKVDIFDVDAAIYLLNHEVLPEGMDANADGIPDCRVE